MNDQDDLHVDVLDKEMVSGFVPAPRILNLKCIKREAVEIEYEYSDLAIMDAPNLRQWVEITAQNMTKREPMQWRITWLDEIRHGTKHEHDFEESKGTGWTTGKFEFPALTLHSFYRFSVKLSNCITFSQSDPSRAVAP